MSKAVLLSSGQPNATDGPLVTLAVPDHNGQHTATAIGSEATVYTPTSGKKFRLMGGEISVSAAGYIVFRDGTAGTIIWTSPKLAADTPYNFLVRSGQGILSAAANNVLTAQLSVVGNLTGTLEMGEE